MDGSFRHRFGTAEFASLPAASAISPVRWTRHARSVSQPNTPVSADLTIRGLLFVSALAFAVPTSAQTPDEIHGTAGCYALTVTEWSPPDQNAAYHRIPRFIRLDTARAKLGRGWVLSPNIAYPYHAGLPPSWRFLRDTLLLVWSNGFQVTGVKLTRADSGWTGEAVAESDDRPIPAPPLPRSQVTALRKTCADTLR